MFEFRPDLGIRKANGTEMEPDGACRSPNQWFLMFWLRSIGIAFVFGVGLYGAGLFRTQELGFSFANTLLTLLFIGPFAVLPFLGLRWRDLATGWIAILMGVVGMVEAAAVWEEYRFQQACLSAPIPADAPPVFQSRHWPFESHHLTFDPRTAAFSAGD